MYGLRIEHIHDHKAMLPGGGWVELGRELRIGRGGDNTLVLDDAVGIISKYHCTISNTEDGCILRDHSRNGSFLNGAGQAVEREKPIALKTGDFIQIGHYVLTMVGAFTSGIDGVDQTDATPLTERSLLGPILRRSSNYRLTEGEDASLPSGPFRPAGIGGFSDDSLTADDSLMLQSRSGRSDSLAPARLDHTGVTNMVYVQPRLSTEAIPDDWDILADITSEPVHIDDEHLPNGRHDQPVERREPPPAFTASEEDSRNAILMFVEGCGLQAADLEGKDVGALMLRVGQALKVTITNFQQELAWRDGASLPRRPNPAEINPLKFAQDVRDVTLALLAPNASDRPFAHEAIDQAFDEMRRHTSEAGARVAQRVLAALEPLSPDVIENQTGETLTIRYLPVVKRSEHWKLYCNSYPDIVAKVARFAAVSRDAERPDETRSTSAETSMPASTNGLT